MTNPEKDRIERAMRSTGLAVSDLQVQAVVAQVEKIVRERHSAEDDAALRTEFRHEVDRARRLLTSIIDRYETAMGQVRWQDHARELRSILVEIPSAAEVDDMYPIPPDQETPDAENGLRLYATAEEARWAVDDAAYADGGQPNPHTYLGGISDEAECYCGIQMPLNEDGSARLTFEEWIEYHDEAQMRTLETDAALYAESDEHPDNQPPRTRPIPPGQETPDA